ncbi:N-acetyltransferase [Actinorhabdospora filicis]|uniref:N-acetyltransferase n=1 Tax=Actinorhabdospora filicis TaxID=1785913 RepID=A0A9W6SHU7_9ACTN|nr:GNAT family N-acetyltransferase [Actinorhabdospora filicis]GLZ75766.1 N-acetyltransferase [Actinorhabdospora filicis]
MTEAGNAAWTPDPIVTERLVVREPEARDRAGYIDLFSSPEVNAYLGGPQPRETLEERMPENPAKPGVLTIERDGAMVGMVKLAPHTPDSHRREAGAVELGYLLLPAAWGHGYAAEACAAVLARFTAERPGEAVVLYTQTANEPSVRLAAKLGFTEVERFEAFGAEQWFGVLRPVA